MLMTVGILCILMSMISRVIPVPVQETTLQSSIFSKQVCFQMTGNKLPDHQLKTLMAAQTLAQDRHFSNTGPGAELELLPW